MENKELQKKREDEKFCPERIGSYFLVEWKALTVCDSCLAFSNRFCKVYSERSCLKCVLNNTVAPSLSFSNE